MRHGDNLTPTLLMLVTQLITEEISTALKASKVEIINLKHDEVNGNIKLHVLKDTTSVSTKEANILAHVDDN